MSRLSTIAALFLLLSLLSILSPVNAWVPRTPTATQPIIKRDDSAAMRQTSRRKVLARQAIKRNADLMDLIERTNQDSWKHHKKPHHSHHSYPKCKTGEGFPGYARYPGWDLTGDNLTNGGIKANSEDECLLSCIEDDFSKRCIGVVYEPSKKKCFPKGAKYGDSTDFTHKDAVATSSKEVLDLAGGCKYWSNKIPVAMDSDCCESW